MVPAVLETLKRRHMEQGEPTEGWVFPANTKSGHTEEDALKRSHSVALTESKVTPFPPYCLRHTALTDLGNLGVDPFTIKKIAGHSSISITERYVHLQADAVERAFNKMTKSQKVVTEGGHPENGSEPELIGASVNIGNKDD